MIRRNSKSSGEPGSLGLLPFLWKPVLFLACLGVYLLTLGPAFLDDDSAETIAAAFTLGLQHPPSYSLDALLGRLACFLPLGGVCFRVNFLSALLGSLGALLLALNLLYLLQRISDSFPSGQKKRLSFAVMLLCALFAAALMAFSRTTWEKALGAKGGIYLLQMVLLLGIFHGWMRSEEGPSRFFLWFYFSLFLFGLGLANHWEMGLVFLPVLPFFFFAVSKGKTAWLPPRAATLVRALCFLILGASPLLYLPLRAHLHPALNLGNPDTFPLFIGDFFRTYNWERESSLVSAFFQALSGHSPWEWLRGLFNLIVNDKGSQISLHLVEQMKWPSLMLALLGVVFVWRSGFQKILLFLLLPMAILMLALCSSYCFPRVSAAGWYMHNLLIPLNWVTAFLAALGLAWLAGGFQKTGFPERARVYSILLCLAAWAVPLFLAVDNVARLDEQRQTLRYDYGVNLLKSAPRDAILFAEGDEDYFPLYFFQNVGGLRADVKMIPGFILFESWGARQIQRLYPALELTASSRSFSGPFDRIIFCLAEIVEKNKNRAPCSFSLLDGAFHRFFLAKNPGLTFFKSGLLLELETPLTRQGPWLEPAALRTRHVANDPTNHHESLQGVRGVYRLMGVDFD